jgi:CheY-like chemotaxis protein
VLDLGDTVGACSADSNQSIEQLAASPTSPKAVFAYGDDSVRQLLQTLHVSIGPLAIDEARDGNQLDQFLLSGGPYTLVISQAALPGMRALDVLSRARARGDSTPFILIQSIHENFVRITLGGGSNSVVSTRLVNTVALFDLVRQIVSSTFKPSLQ